MSDPYESVRLKALEILTELVGDRAKRLDGSVLATPAMDAITNAMIDRFGLDKAIDIGFHLADWNSDAAFIVSLHLFPERFTPEEVAAGVEHFLLDVPYHIREVCRITDYVVWESVDDEKGKFTGEIPNAE